MKNNSSFKNLIGVLALFALFSCGVYFLSINKFNAFEFITFLLVASIIVISLISIDRLRELDLKNLKLVLDEIKVTRKDIYAKAEELNRIIESLAENYIYSALDGRISSEAFSFQKEMIKKRDMAKYLLEKAGWKNDKIIKKIERIDQLIFHDFVREIEHIAYNILEKREKERRQVATGRTHISKMRKLGEMDPEFSRLIDDAKTNDEIIANIKFYTESHSIPLESIRSELDQLEFFLKNKNLK